MENLPKQSHPDLLVGVNNGDDSGVFRLSDELALIMTVDFFPAVVDDPYVFGQVAAANSLSDVYAMGGRPLSALNIVGFPEGRLPLEVLGEVLKGGADKVREAGAVIAGGHTIKDSELKYGLSVVGLIHPDRIVRIGGARDGDALIMTKPLGTGIYSTALKTGSLQKGAEELLYDVMTTLNSEAAEGMIRFGAHACTDITGFGLIGHALEMARSSGVTLAFDLDKIPILPRALELARKGFVTVGGNSNHEFSNGNILSEDSLAKPLEMILHDPQTSGGLLVALPAKNAEPYVSHLHERGIAGAVRVGEVIPDSGRGILLRA